MVLVFKLARIDIKAAWTLFVNKVSTGPAHSIWDVICEIYYPYQRPKPEHMKLGFKFWLN